MGRQGKIMLDVPSGTLAAMAVLGMAFLLGGGAGCLLGGMVNGAGGSALSDYLQTYLTLAQDGTEGAPGFWAVLWEQMRFPLAALLMGFTALGVIGLPVLFAVRGFLFSFSVACFCRLFGGAGLIPALFLFGLPALLWAPALFVLGAQGMLGAYGLLRRVTGDSRYPLSYDTAYGVRCALCGGKLQSKYGRAGKYLRCRTHAVAPERCPGVSIRRDEAAQCVLEALQDCMARYLDREYLARHLRPPEAAAHRQEQLALRAARLEQALARQRACRKTLYEDRVDGAVTAAQFAELSAAFEAEIARLGKELAAAERERGAAAEQAAQCVTAEQLVKKYARADVLTDEMAECMVEAVLVGRPERQRRPVPLEIRWRF